MRDSNDDTSIEEATITRRTIAKGAAGGGLAALFAAVGAGHVLADSVDSSDDDGLDTSPDDDSPDTSPDDGVDTSPDDSLDTSPDDDSLDTSPDDSLDTSPDDALSAGPDDGLGIAQSASHEKHRGKRKGKRRK